VYVYLVKVNAVTVWLPLVLCNAPFTDTRGLVIPLSWSEDKKTSIEDVERGVSEHWSRDFRISSGGAADPMAL
jgi:hypothetical protein